jgi:hypothetical protein
VNAYVSEMHANAEIDPAVGEHIKVVLDKTIL